MTTHDEIVELARAEGLLAMGALHPDRLAAKGVQGGTLILLGAGPGFWEVLQAAPEMLDGRPDPVDRWSRRVIGALADSLRAVAHFPFGGPPYAPFIDWAIKSGRAFVSPTGMLVHDVVGLMISYRGALHLPDEIPLPDAPGASPCTSCAGKPCLTACPVGALGETAPYDVAACHAYLDTAAGRDCLERGCRVRRSCPVSAGADRKPAQSAHHMKAFHPS